MRVQALAVAARAVAVAALGDLPVVVAVGRVAALVLAAALFGDLAATLREHCPATLAEQQAPQRSVTGL